MRRLVVRSLLATSVAAGLVCQIPEAPASAAEFSIVYVDIDRIISECDEGHEAAEVLKREQQKRQTEIASREADIKRMQDDLEKQSKVLSREAIERKVATYQQALAEYQALAVRFQKELGDREKELFDPIERKLREMLRVMALRDGYDLVLSKRSVPFGRRDLDLTERVTQEYNRTYPVAAAGKKKDEPKRPAQDNPKKADQPAPKK